MGNKDIYGASAKIVRNGNSEGASERLSGAFSKNGGKQLGNSGTQPQGCSNLVRGGGENPVKIGQGTGEAVGLKMWVDNVEYEPSDYFTFNDTNTHTVIFSQCEYAYKAEGFRVDNTGNDNITLWLRKSSDSAPEIMLDWEKSDGTNGTIFPTQYAVSGNVIGLSPGESVWLKRNEEDDYDIPFAYTEDAEILGFVSIMGGTGAIADGDPRYLTNIETPFALSNAFGFTTACRIGSDLGELYRIGDNAFSGNKSLTLFTLNSADYSTEIGERAFAGSRLSLFQSFRKLNIDNEAFDQSLLQEFDSRDDIYTIGERAFNGCAKLTSFAARKVEEIQEYAFYGCIALRSFPFNGINRIGTYAFQNTRALLEVNLPSCEVGEYAFYNSGVRELVARVEDGKWDNNVFYSCTRLSQITLYCGSHVGVAAFELCKALKTVEIQYDTDVSDTLDFDERIFNEAGTNVGFTVRCTTKDGSSPHVRVGEKSFYKSGISSIVGTIDEIGEYSFSESLINEIPVIGTWASVGQNAFDGCDRITSLLLDAVSYNGVNIFANCANLRTADIRQGQVHELMFNGCNNLRTLILLDDYKDSVPHEIGNLALANCGALTSIYCLSEEPFTDYGMFESGRSLANLKIYVPASAIDNYKASLPQYQNNFAVLPADFDYEDYL